MAWQSLGIVTDIAKISAQDKGLSLVLVLAFLVLPPVVLATAGLVVRGEVPPLLVHLGFHIGFHLSETKQFPKFVEHEQYQYFSRGL